MIQGGIPQRHLIVTIGTAGTGKTTFGLQFLHHGLRNGENAVFLTLEQSHDAILDTAGDRGWGFEEYEEQGQHRFSTSTRSRWQTVWTTFAAATGAHREVRRRPAGLDAVSLLEMMYDDQSRRRLEVSISPGADRPA